MPMKHQVENVGDGINEQLSELEIQLLDPIDTFSIPRFWQTVRSFKRLKGIIQKHEIEVIHVLFGEPNGLWAIGKKYLGVKMFLTSRGTDVLVTIPKHFEELSLQNLYVRQLYKFAFAQFDRIISTSSKQVSAIKRYFSVKRQPSVIRTGIEFPDLDKYKDSMLPEGLNPNKYVLMPRNMGAIYNHEFTLQAIDLLPEKVKSTYEFVFVDADSDQVGYVNEIHAIMERMIGVKFRFLNRQSQNDLHILYAYCGAVVMNPVSDGTPVSALEAMAFKKPLILGPIEYDKDLFGDWVIKLSSWNGEELAQEIEYALSKFPDDKLVKAHNKAHDHGNRQVEMAKLEKLYKEELQWI